MSDCYRELVHTDEYTCIIWKNTLIKTYNYTTVQYCWKTHRNRDCTFWEYIDQFR